MSHPPLGISRKRSIATCALSDHRGVTKRNRTINSSIFLTFDFGGIEYDSFPGTAIFSGIVVSSRFSPSDGGGLPKRKPPMSEGSCYFAAGGTKLRSAR